MSELSHNQEHSLLNKVQEHIIANNNVSLVGQWVEEPKWQASHTSFVQFVNLVVASRNPIYEARRLNEVLKTLELPNIPFSNSVYFHSYEGDLSVGLLSYDDKVGEEKVTHDVKINDLALADRIGIPKESEVRNIKLYRRTQVRLYPDSNVASILLEYKQGFNSGNTLHDENFEGLEYRITKSQIDALKRNQNPFKKIVGLIQGR